MGGVGGLLLVFLLSLFSLIFNLSFSTSKIAFSASNVAFAQEELSIKEATPSSETKTEEKIEYELPYPGILPDHPLYFLKMIRDRIVGFLIADPLKKAEFNLLQSDKRLNSGVYLVGKGKDKYNLAVSTISKGENYFEEAIKKTKEAQKQGMDTKDILRRLSNTSKKHQEVLQSLSNKVPQDLRDDYVLLQKRARDFEAQVTSLIPE